MAGRAKPASPRKARRATSGFRPLLAQAIDGCDRLWDQTPAGSNLRGVALREQGWVRRPCEPHGLSVVMPGELLESVPLLTIFRALRIFAALPRLVLEITDI